MSALVCSLSGSPLMHPVVSNKTGHLYEKSTILHYISIYKVCPHTGSPLDASNLVDIVNTNTTILPSQQTVPLLTEKLLSEMDVMILEAHLLKQSLRERREELATSLYRQDAAIRVVAKLKAERDTAR